MSARAAFIFDIDSVLVEPRGYRAAVRATQAYFTHAMGLDDGLLVDDEIYNLFEICRVTSEWDMVPIALAILLEEILEAHPELGPFNNLETCMQAVRGIPPGFLPARINYRAPIQALREFLKPGNFPSQQILRLAQANSSTPEDSAAHRLLRFLTLAKTPVLEILLAHTRDVDRSPTTRLFQQFTLGSKVFTQTYDLPAEVETPGYLQAYDLPLISRELGTTLANLNRSGDLALCAYTMRPSLPPRTAQVEDKGYSPEAEMALELVNLTGIPLIGYGRIYYLARETGWPAEGMLKPSPVQAIAAILASASGDELSALHAALGIYQGKPIDLQRFNFGEELSVHIFEDSAGGIDAMRSAGDLLARMGAKIQVHPHGIGNNPEKEAALQPLQIPIFPSTEAALHAALSEEQL
jgi:hypothetical protein